MRILVTGASGYVGSALLARLDDAHAAAQPHQLRALVRRAAPAPALAGVETVVGDALTGAGLDAALEGVEVAYYLIHSMEPAASSAHGTAFVARERRAATNFVDAARRAGVRRIVYLGGVLPADPPSRHLSSRHAVERILLDGVPDSVALRASIVLAARSRSFRLLVRLVERLPLLILPAWSENRTAPIDGRDVLEFLVAAASAALPERASLDIAGPDVLTYGELLAAISDAMIVSRPTLRLGVSATALLAPVAAAIAGERPELTAPLMESLRSDLLPRDRQAERLLGVRVHSFAAALAHSLSEWERGEPLAAR